MEASRVWELASELPGAQTRRLGVVRSSRDAIPCVLAWGGRVVRRMFELVMAAQVHDLDAVGVQTLVIDQPLGQHQRL